MTLSCKTPFYAFGLKVNSEWEIPCSRVPHTFFTSIRLARGTEEFFSAHVPEDLRRLDPERIHYRPLDDGSHYLRWRSTFEFHISADSRVVTAYSLDGAPEAAFKTYMLGHLFSFVLLGMGKETIHAASIVIDGRAIGILGDSARGKSTLSAAFLHAGHQLLSDDFLVLGQEQGLYLAYPGIPRIKLYERVAESLAPKGKKGTPMIPMRRPKMVYSVEDVPTHPVPLHAFYSLASPRKVGALKEVRLEDLSARQAYLELTENSFNISVNTPQRLASQFHWATELAKQVPVKRLYYPRVLDILPEVIRTVTDDLALQENSARKALSSTLATRKP